MTFHIRITKPAQIDMQEILRYIAEDLHNRTAAVRRVTLIDDKIKTLNENPLRFPLIRDRFLASKGFRMLVVKNHLVFFVVREESNTVTVMRVLYGRRDWMHILNSDSDSLTD